MAETMSQGKRPHSIWGHNLRLKECRMEGIIYRDKDLNLPTATKPILVKSTVHHHKFAYPDPR
jgi:hypothetical protein